MYSEIDDFQENAFFFIFSVLSEPFSLSIIDQISKAIPLFDSKFNGDSENGFFFGLRSRFCDI